MVKYPVLSNCDDGLLSPESAELEHSGDCHIAWLLTDIWVRGRRQEAGGRRQEAGSRRQETGGRRLEALTALMTITIRTPKVKKMQPRNQ